MLDELRVAAEKGENVMPYILRAVKAYATLGEIMGVLKGVHGEWIEEPLY
ncbi:MAG: methylmalonyl-CoA mutase family protein [Candidatus Njordarchaeia archaeon]